MAAPRDPHASHPGYETRDLDTRSIVIAGAGLAAAVVVFAALMWGLFHWFAAREERRAAPLHPLAEQLRPELPPEPRLQRAPREDLLELRAREERVLTSYAWVDRDKGIVRIPIDRAIEILAERGLPARGGEAR